jgi:dTDP-4-dehydrorhamnose 3,5-epimerase
MDGVEEQREVHLKFTPTKLAGVFLIDVERRVDARGFFGRTWCEREMAAQGLSTKIVNVNTAVSTKAGTLRGMHYQVAPFAEVKIIRCYRGAVYDVIVDLRTDSNTYLQWFGAELTGDNATMLYAPEGCAHGYLTLTDDAELSYSTSQFYAPDAARGARYDDPAFDIRWPGPAQIVSDQDLKWPKFAQ